MNKNIQEHFRICISVPLSCEEFPIVLIRSYEIDSFIMGYHVYKTNLTPVVGEKLSSLIESNSLMDKYAVARDGFRVSQVSRDD